MNFVYKIFINIFSDIIKDNIQPPSKIDALDQILEFSYFTETKTSLETLKTFLKIDITQSHNQKVSRDIYGEKSYNKWEPNSRIKEKCQKKQSLKPV